MLAGLLAIASGIYVAQNFKIDTDINKLISPDLPGASRNWRFPGISPARHYRRSRRTNFRTRDKRKFGTNARIIKA